MENNVGYYISVVDSFYSWVDSAKVYKNRLIFFESTFDSIVQYFAHNPWNIVDTLVNTCVFVYIILMTQITSLPYAIQNPMDLDIRHLWNLETLSQISKVFVSVGVVLAFLRFLNFFLEE